MNQSILTRAARPSLMLATETAVRTAREQNPLLRLLLPSLRVVQRRWPAGVAALLERLLSRAPASSVPAAGRDFLARGQRFEFRLDGRRIVGWTWGSGPTTYLVHGWGSRAGRLHLLGEALVRSGRRLVMFDAPGHGASGRGLSSMPEFARALQAVVAREGAPDAVIAHSMGGAATALAAAWGLEARRFVLLAPAANPAEWARSLGLVLALERPVLLHLRARSERRLRLRWDEFDARLHARRMTAPLLVIHDHEDDIVPFSHGADLARLWPGATLVETSGLGHRDLLQDPAVIGRVLDFVAAGAAEGIRSAGAELERELFDPATRRLAG